MVTKDPSPYRKLRKVFKNNFGDKMRFQYQKNIKKTKSPKMTSKFLYKLINRSCEQFKAFSQILNLAIDYNPYVNHRKTKHHGKLNFRPETIKKL